MPRIQPVAALLLVLSFSAFPICAADSPLEVGFAAVDISPPIDPDHPIFLAGLEANRVATKIHDPLFARAIAFHDGNTTIALVSVDSIGVQFPTVTSVRQKLPQVDYLLVASTHTHAAPDCVGIWGPDQTTSGVSDSYLAQLESGIVRAVREALANRKPSQAFYGTVSDVSMLGDFRLPNVYDPVLRTLRFEDADGKTAGILVQWNAHGIEPRDNPQVTRDFMGVTTDELARRHDCPVIYFSGAIGGLMGTPDSADLFIVDGKRISDAFQALDIYGRAVADLADRALDAATHVQLAPIRVAPRLIAIPLDNPAYRMARKIGVLPRPAFAATGNRDEVGAPVPLTQIEGDLTFATEVACLRLGELHIAAIPGELYPELVYGEFQKPVDPAADYPDADLEPTVMDALPGEKHLVLGLANDEIGYILPRRQWDTEAPFCYGRKSSQYGEQNSVGPFTAHAIGAALADCVADLNKE